MKKVDKFVLTDFNCKECGGRILERVGSYATGGGNPIFKCASCERTICDIGPDSIGTIRTGNNRDREYILCAAILYADGRIYVHQPKNVATGFVVTGRRHHNCIATFGILNREKLMDYKKLRHHEGFLTNTNRFVSRQEAYEIAVAAGQALRKEDPKWLKSIPQLYSEDVW